MDTTTTPNPINAALANLFATAPVDERTLCLPGLTGPGWGSYQLTLAQFEAAFQDARRAFDESLADDTLAERIPQDYRNQCELVWSREGKQGGAHDRPPPELDELLAAAAGCNVRRNITGGRPGASLEELGERLHFVYWHRGRGLSDVDAEYQREWTRGRSLGVGYFISKNERGDRVGLPAVVRTKLGRAVASRMELVAWVVEAKRLGYAGISISAAEFERTTGISERTFWRAVSWLERKGFLTVLRTYKSGQGERPIGLCRNWYGPGPALRELAPAFMPEQAELFDADQAARLRLELKAEVRRRIAKRRRGRARELGFLSRLEFARQVVEHAEDHERRAAEHQAEEREAYSAADQLNEQINAGELPPNWLDVGALVTRRVGALGEPPRLFVPAVVVDVARALLASAEKLGAWLREGVGVLYDRAAAFAGRLLVRDGDESPGGSLPWEAQPDEIGQVFAEQPDPSPHELATATERARVEAAELAAPEPVEAVHELATTTERGAKKSSDQADAPLVGCTPMTLRHGPPDLRGTSSNQGMKPAPRASTSAIEPPDAPATPPRKQQPEQANSPNRASAVELGLRSRVATDELASSGIATRGPSRVQQPPEVAAALPDEDRALLGRLWSPLAALAAQWRVARDGSAARPSEDLAAEP